jgi:hypothetical protein
MRLPSPRHGPSAKAKDSPPTETYVCPAHDKTGDRRPGSGWHARAVAAALLALLFLVLAGSTAADLDMFHEMALVRESLSAGRLLNEDVHAYTPTVSPVIHHEWATGAVLYAVAVSAGLGGGGVLALRILLFAIMAACCWWRLRLAGAPRAAIVVLAPIAITMMAVGTTPVRAHLFTFAFTAVLLAFFELDRRGARWWLAAWLPLYVLWLNLHGGFVVGAGLFGLHAAERLVATWRDRGAVRPALEAHRHLLLGGGAMLVLLLANPYGTEYVPYLWHALRLERPLVAEWAPLWDSRVQGEYVMFYVASLLVLAYSLLRAPDPLRLPGLLLVLVTAFMAARSQRLLPVHAIVWIAHVPGYLTATELHRMIESIWARHRALLAGVALAFAVVASARSIHLRFWELQVPAVDASASIRYPVGAVDYLAEHGFRGNLMTPFSAGAFVSWKLYPAVLIGMDSRYEVAYPTGAVEENVALYAASLGWDEILLRYPTDAVLVPLQSRLYETLETAGAQSSGWVRVYHDDGYAVFARSAVAERLPAADRSGEMIVGRFP